MRVLITGIAGFIGSNLADAIPPEHELFGVDTLMRGRESTRNLDEIGRPFEFKAVNVGSPHEIVSYVKEVSPHVIYHFAAQPSHRLMLQKSPLEYFYSDLASTVHILEAMRLYAPRALLVFASSNKVYGKQPIPFREDMPRDPHGHYAMAKAASEGYMEQYARYHGIRSVAARFHHVIGARCHSELVLPMFVERALLDEPLTVNGRADAGGTWTACAADFTPIHDLITGLLLFLRPSYGVAESEYVAVNFGRGAMTSVMELAQMVLYHTHSHSAIQRGIAAAHESLVHLADVSKAREWLGWASVETVDEAVGQYVEWRRSHESDWCVGLARA